MSLPEQPETSETWAEAVNVVQAEAAAQTTTAAIADAEVQVDFQALLPIERPARATTPTDANISQHQQKIASLQLEINALREQVCASANINATGPIHACACR
jgi:hypothetical protein